MQRLLRIFIGVILLSAGLAAQAASNKIIKVLPHYLDLKGRQSLAPSLFERDAYQAQLRKHPEQRSTMRFDVQWKAKGVDWSRLKMKVELRGSIKSGVVEQAITRHGWWSYWIALTLDKQTYVDLGDIVAWRVTLWEGDTQLAEQKSFLW